MHSDEPREDELRGPGSAEHDPGAGFPVIPLPSPEHVTTPLPMPYVPAAAPFARAVAVDSPDLLMTIIIARGRRDIPWWLAILELLALTFVGITGATAAVPIMQLLQPNDDRWFSVIGTGTAGLAVIVACLVTLKLEGRPLSSIGLTLRAAPLNVLLGLGGWIGTLALLIAISIALSMLFPQLNEHDMDSAKAIQDTFPPMNTLSLVAFMAFVATWEEIVFRGFMLTRLQAIFKRWWLTLPVGAVLFGLGHVYQGPIAVPLTMLLGIAMGLLFWWRKSLVPGIVFHAVFNIVNTLVITKWMTNSSNT